MTAAGGTRSLAALVAILLAIGSSMSAARAGETPQAPLNLPSPTTESGDHHEEVAPPAMSRLLDGGNARTYNDGDRLTYRVKVSQTLQPKGPQTAEARTSTLDLVMTESVKVRNGEPEVTLQVEEAEAEGFLAEAEERSALERRVVFTPAAKEIELVLKEGRDGKPDLRDLETIRPYGDLGAVRMVDMALKAHLLNPVIPSEDFSEGDNFDDNAAFPAGWTRGAQSLDGSISVEGEQQRDGRAVLKVNGVHITTDTLLRVTAMDNAVEALQGLVPPEPNEFFAGTMFDALFPKGSTYESLMPQLPLSVKLENRRRRTVRPVRRRRGLGLVFGSLMILGLASCSNPERNPDIVSLNLTGPIQLNHESVIDRSSGILISSEVTANARLAGQVYPIPDVLVPHLKPEVNAVSRADIGMDADWTITEELESELPEPSSATSSAGVLIPAGIAVVLGLGVAALVRKRKRSQKAPPEAGGTAEEEPPPAQPPSE